MACVVQKLLYNLESAWLNKTLIQKLDGFFARCMRQILKISHSYISRVSNKYVLQKFQAPALSSILLQRRLLLFGEIARLSNEDVVRQTVFHENDINIKLALSMLQLKLCYSNMFLRLASLSSNFQVDSTINR